MTMLLKYLVVPSIWKRGNLGSVCREDPYRYEYNGVTVGQYAERIPIDMSITG